MVDWLGQASGQHWASHTLVHIGDMLNILLGRNSHERYLISRHGQGELPSNIFLHSEHLETAALLAHTGFFLANNASNATCLALRPGVGQYLACLAPNVSNLKHRSAPSALPASGIEENDAGSYYA